MKRYVIALTAAAAMGAFFQVQSVRTAADFIPAGALLTVETKDFASIVREWNASPEKAAWIGSANFASFSRSNLYLKLESARAEFAEAAGVPLAAPMIETVAGGESALAIYDIGRLQFLYITRLPSGGAIETALEQNRARFSPRLVAGHTFYVRTDTASRRVAAFATANGWLILATREDLIAGALALVAAQSGAESVNRERWYQQAAAASQGRGDLRLVIDLNRVARTPHFRTYWIQRNAAELRAYASAVVDLHRSSGEIREERVLLRSESRDAVSVPLGQLMRLAPPAAGLIRTWARPAARDAAALLEHKVLAPKASNSPPSKFAPSVELSDSGAGTEADLEIRISEPPFASRETAFISEPVTRLLESARIEAMMHSESSRLLPDGVFVDTETAIAVQAESDWNGEAVRAALLNSIQSLWSTSRIGLSWSPRGQGRTAYHDLGSLARVAVYVAGRTLIVTNSPAYLESMLSRIATADSGLTATYAARFDHAREHPNYVRMMSLIDHPFIDTQAQPGSSPREPQFFSENVADLSKTLSRIESASIVARERGAAVHETVTYRLRQ